MSMTSNSRARRIAVAAGLLLAPGAPGGAEAPLPRVSSAPPAVVRVQATPAAVQRVRLVDVRVVDVPGDDRRLRRLAGAGRDFQAREGAIVVARVATPFVDSERTASPVIVIAGRPVESVVDEETRRTVYALIPAWAANSREVTMQVGWLGDFERTLSNPVALSLAPTRPLRRRNERKP